MSFRFFSNCSEKQPSSPFCLDLDWQSLCEQVFKGHRIIIIFITNLHHLSSSLRNLTTCFNPGVKVSSFAFQITLVLPSFCLDFGDAVHDFLNNAAMSIYWQSWPRRGDNSMTKGPCAAEAAF